jgi:glycosyltransferase involved in cell wall biosynthesis
MSKSPRVIFGPEIWSLQIEGGISRYFQQLIRGLSESEIGGKVLTQNHANSRMSSTHIKGFEIQSLKDLKNPYKEISRLLGQETQGSIFHPTYYSQKLVDIQEPKTKMVLTVFDMISELYPERKPRFRKVVDEKKISLQKADHILSISKQTKDDLVRIYKVPEEKITVTYLGSNLHLHPEAASENLPSGAYILYVGKRSGYKNFSNFVTAYSHSKSLISNFSIIAVGGGEFSPGEMLELQNLKIADKVIQVNANDGDLASYYRKAACLVYPSLYEGFGLPPLEAMSLNCAVIASSGGSIPEICNGAAQYFDPTNVDSIEQVLKATLSDEQQMQKMRLMGLIIAESFTWEKTAADTIAVYKRLLIS